MLLSEREADVEEEHGLRRRQEEEAPEQTVVRQRLEDLSPRFHYFDSILPVTLDQ